MARKQNISVAKEDLVAAWMILENLAVSLDQLGGAFVDEVTPQNGRGERRILQEALDAYLTPERVQEIKAARRRLRNYLTDQEAEKLADDRIRYWDYAGLARLRKQSSKASGTRKRATARP